MERDTLQLILCLSGSIFVVAIGALFLWGRHIALPFRQSRPLTFVFFLVLLYYLCFFGSICPYLPQSENLQKIFPPRQVLGEVVQCVILLFLVFLSILSFWIRNRYVVQDLYPMRQSTLLLAELEQRHALNRSFCMEAKKIEALALELGLVVLSLAQCASTHPLMLVLQLRSKVKRLRSVIDNLIKVFAQSPGGLDHALHRVNVPQLVAFASKGTLDIIRSQTENLSRDVKAVLLDALQKNGFLIRNNYSRQEWVVELFLSTSGTHLLVIKSVLDGGGDYQSLRKLIYEDITHEPLRQKVLDHFMREAQYNPHDNSLKEDILMRKILSDIDDTLFSSGGKFPAGIDKRFPRKAVYPGLLQFYMELDTQWKLMKLLPRHMLKSTDAGNLDTKFCNLIFLSARPHVYKDFSEKFTYNLLSHFHRRGLLHEMPTMIPGRLGSSISGMVSSLLRRSHAWHQVGLQKLESIRKCIKLYPSYMLIFFGDNGQGDLLAAELALQEAPPLLKLAFINEVQPRRRSLSMFSSLPVEEQEMQWKNLGIVFMKTPVEGAVEAARRGLLSAESLARVCESAVNDMEALMMRHPEHASWTDRIEELNNALKDAQAIRDNIQLLDRAVAMSQVRNVMDIFSGSVSPQLQVALLSS